MTVINKKNAKINLTEYIWKQEKITLCPKSSMLQKIGKNELNQDHKLDVNTKFILSVWKTTWQR